MVGIAVYVHDSKLPTSSDPHQLILYMMHVLTLSLEFWLTYILRFYLAFFPIWHSIWHSVWHFIWYTFWRSISHSIWLYILTSHLASGARRWGSAVLTDIWRSRLRSGSAHWDLEPAVEARQCPLSSQFRPGTARSWGPAVPIEIWSSLLGGTKEGKDGRRK
jgi:hypothetical protein